MADEADVANVIRQLVEMAPQLESIVPVLEGLGASRDAEDAAKGRLAELERKEAAAYERLVLKKQEHADITEKAQHAKADADRILAQANIAGQKITADARKGADKITAQARSDANTIAAEAREIDRRRQAEAEAQLAEVTEAVNRKQLELTDLTRKAEKAKANLAAMRKAARDFAHAE